MRELWNLKSEQHLQILAILGDLHYYLTCLVDPAHIFFSQSDQVVLMNFLRFFYAVLLPLCLFPSISHAVVSVPPSGRLLVFDENPFNGSPRGFYQFDFQSSLLSLVTEVASPVGDRFTGFEWNPENGLVYAGSSNGNLYSINLGSGDFDLVGQIPVIGSGNQPRFVRGITFEPTSNQMYGLGFGPRLYSIDSATANSKVVGFSPDIDGGIAFTPDGRLWGWTPQRKLLEVSPLTANTIQTFSSRLPVMSNLTGAPDNRLFGVDWQNGGIVEINTTTGIGTTIASFSEHSNGMIGAIFVVPEPQSCIMLGGFVISLLAARPVMRSQSSYLQAMKKS